jgi:hypothetical protein
MDGVLQSMEVHSKYDSKQEEFEKRRQRIKAYGTFHK